MGKNRIALFLLLLVFIHGVMIMTATGYEEEAEEEYVWGSEGEGEQWGRGEEGEEEWGGGGGEKGRFLMRESRQVIRTEAGDMRVVLSPRGRIIEKPMHIGFLTMEPQSLFVPQYLDSSLLIFVRRGEARLGVMCEDEFGEKRLKAGDIYWIPAGSVFYLVNTGIGQRLHVICSIDPADSLGLETFQSFYIGGGAHPPSILSGFDIDTLATAFNVSGAELRQMLTGQVGGPIVHIAGGERAPALWTKFLELRDEEKHMHLKRISGMSRESSSGYRETEEHSGWMSWRKLLRSMLSREGTNRKTRCEDSYNIYDRKPDFRNDYGWSIALDSADYRPLKHSGISVYLVILNAGSMMAPHMNPTATEYGVVLSGAGDIEVVLPNGKLAMKRRVAEGDVFWIPRYFAFCQIASRTGPFKFFGFTTSARRNRPQFFVGSNSLLRSLNIPELAAAFGVDNDTMRRFVGAQGEAVILPTAGAAPPDVTEKKAKTSKVAKKVIDGVMGLF
ncbi:PREDICTED: vicilin-like seed storage protein At2g28490 [Tarenaya hassleriana]|uniref:vicilin-like seed storage protein At2g28490 n=1 Tax=Tarenaya hassleriana TaxID=28532 RepID=UPI00053C0CAB|nr:PREDICTED: vicilin-like seed storage protein At2g28490 [Tarenaya hassleriana]